MKLDDVYIQSVLPKMGVAHCLYCNFYVKSCKILCGDCISGLAATYRTKLILNARVDLWEVQQLLS